MNINHLYVVKLESLILKEAHKHKEVQQAHINKYNNNN